MNRETGLDATQEKSKVKCSSRFEQVYAQSERLAELHAVLTSPRGDHFRARLLQQVHTRLEDSDLDQLRRDSKLTEYERHIHKLAQFDLIDEKLDGCCIHYERTPRGEQAINTLRELERRVGTETASQIYDASLGVNSIRLFLKLYDVDHTPNVPGQDIIFQPSEIGRICRLLPRTVEGYAALDKLNDAGLLSCRDDNVFVFAAVKARAVYQYLPLLK